MFIDTIEASITNTGTYTIVPANYRLRDNRLNGTNVQFGFLQIRLNNPEQFSGLRISP